MVIINKYFKPLCSILILFITINFGHAQFFDEFSDNDLSLNPEWKGDLQDFILNEDEELQLNSFGEGPSLIYTEISLLDSITWDFEVTLDFAPSGFNKIRFYLALDTIDIGNANGYFVEIGESGSADVFRLFKLTQGETEELASGFGSLADQPAYCQFKANYFEDGSWELNTRYTLNTPLITEQIIFEELTIKEKFKYFAIECYYTSSRADKFFIDNVGVKEFTPDISPPEVLDVIVIDPLHILVVADEPLDLSSAVDPENYRFGNFSGDVVSGILQNNDTEVLLTLSDPMESGKRYIFHVLGIKDVFQNPHSGVQTVIFVLDQPEQGDLLISEILFNPETGGSDFVEIYNRAEKFIDLSSVIISNELRMERKEIRSKFIIGPSEYLCFTEDVNYTKDRYEVPEFAVIELLDIPSFNNDTGNISIILSDQTTVSDAFNYSEAQHSIDLDDINGVSLERISFNLETQDRNNWYSASSTLNYGTPGYRNSNFLNPIPNMEVLSFENETFSPNNDGIDDLLIIKYNFPENGNLVDLEIFDQYGRQVRKLVNNQLVNGEGIFLWDGFNANGEREQIGIYFIQMEYITQEGSVLNVKKPVILADYLD